MTQEERIEKAADIAVKILCKFEKRDRDPKGNAYDNGYLDAMNVQGEFLFKEGAEYALNNQWISVEDKPIPQNGFVLAYHPKWVDEDFNPQGVRIGFMSEDGFVSAYWWDNQDDFVAIGKWRWEDDESQKAFFANHVDNSEPTHWMEIPKIGGEK